MKPFYTHCACRHEIGLTDGQQLLIGQLLIRRSITFWCAQCGRSTYWRPGPGPGPAPAPELGQPELGQPEQMRSL